MRDLIRVFYTIGEVWRVGVRESLFEKKPLERDLGGEWRLASHGWVALQAGEEACVRASVTGTWLEK